MSRRARTATRGKSEPTLALINIVFLMLIFFLAAAQLSRPLDPDMKLVNTEDPEVVPPNDSVVIDADGTASFRGQRAAPEEVWSILQDEGLTDTLRILPDARVDALLVLEQADAFRALGAQKIVIVTEQALR